MEAILLPAAAQYLDEWIARNRAAHNSLDRPRFRLVAVTWEPAISSSGGTFVALLDFEGRTPDGSSDP